MDMHSRQVTIHPVVTLIAIAILLWSLYVLVEVAKHVHAWPF